MPSLDPTPRRRGRHGRRGVHQLLAALGLTVATAVGSVAVAAPASAAPASKAATVTVTVTVDSSLAGPLPVSVATSAWAKGTQSLTFASGTCSGARCVRVVHQHLAVGDSLTSGAYGGWAQGNPDGSCSAYVEPWLDTFPDAQRAALEHELGHCMGLPHNTTDPRSIMAPVLSLGSPPKGPDAQDRADLRTALG